MIGRRPIRVSERSRDQRTDQVADRAGRREQPERAVVEVPLARHARQLEGHQGVVGAVERVAETTDDQQCVVGTAEREPVHPGEQ